MQTVWAYKPLEALGNRLGFVAVSSEVAAELLASGDAQDPRIGGSALLPFQPADAAPKRKAYKRKDITAEE